MAGQSHDERTPNDVFVVFQDSDLNAAVRHVAEAMLVPSALVRVFVEEAIVDKFSDMMLSVEKLAAQLAASSCNETSSRSLDVGGVRKSSSLDETLGLNISHEPVVLDQSHAKASSHSFRTVKDAIAVMSQGEGAVTVLDNISIWHQNHSVAYELVVKLRSSSFCINCFGINMDSLKKQTISAGGFAKIEGQYHYETLLVEGKAKHVAFPIGSIFAN